MENCLIIGGGFAGLSSAVNLSEKAIKITLIESSPKLGGRAYSIFNSIQNDFYDNGQHILLGCYEYTLKFLSKINALESIEFPKNLNINFVDKTGKLHQLHSSNFFFPINLLSAFLKYPVINFRSRLKIVQFLAENMFSTNMEFDELSIYEMLKRKKQTDESIKAFWEILTVGALNSNIERASAKIFCEILRKIFKSKKSSLILLPKEDLSNLYVHKSVKFIQDNGGEIKTSERVLKLIANKNKITKVITNKSIYENFDFIISAIPPHSLKHIEIINSKIEDNLVIPSLNYSPILNVHLWMKENPFEEKFYGLIDSKIHWLFNNNKHISITISAAEEIINLNDKELLSIIYSELEKYFPIFKHQSVIDYKIIKEKRATFIPDVNSIKERKKMKSLFKNFYIAGDWTIENLPSTIESAVMSGYLVSDKIINQLRIHD